MTDTTRQQRPNIVLILADDMGFSDLGCYGSQIATPNLDALAAGGVTFSQMYNCSRCCPSRASLLTGLYPHQAGIGDMVRNLGTPAYQGYLNDRCATVAELLRTGGYRTYMTGKWHVGGVWPRRESPEWRVHDPTKPLPPDRGFDDWVGIPGGGSYYYPSPLMHNYDFVEPGGGLLHHRLLHLGCDPHDRVARSRPRRQPVLPSHVATTPRTGRCMPTPRTSPCIAASTPGAGTRPAPGATSNSTAQACSARGGTFHRATRKRPLGRTCPTRTGRTHEWPATRPWSTAWTATSAGCCRPSRPASWRTTRW